MSILAAAEEERHRAPMKFLRLALVLFFPSLALAGGQYFEVNYPPSTEPGELALGVTYTMWLPDNVAQMRGVIVHQHGCGVGASKGGETAAYDLHWQALAKKWDCALLGPSYHQGEKDNCRLWCDPRNGSAKTFLRALADFARQSGHAELTEVPWCLWGHSGGGFWSSLMLTLHPERIAAIWFRSGSAFGAWSKGEIPPPQLTAAVYQVPIMFNGGLKEESDKRHGPARVADRAMFKAWREKDAPAGFSPDPRTAHECGDSRYLAIPFFDVCLAARLPEKGSTTQRLRPVDMKQAWLAPMFDGAAQPAASFSGNAVEAGWLPNEQIAKARAEYVKTGATSDATPPAAPTNLKATAIAEGVELAWDAEVDFESGLQGFIIQRDGRDFALLPPKPVGKFGRPLFQQMSYHDTPERPLPEMKYRDTSAQPGATHEYRVIAVNSVGLHSGPGKAIKWP
jgi:poly(3-hydroxybutyrate) depolymerase